jgi:hypothetical protein
MESRLNYDPIDFTKGSSQVKQKQKRKKKTYKIVPSRPLLLVPGREAVGPTAA